MISLPIESCGIEWNLNHPAEVSLIPSFWCVSLPFLPRGPARRRHATPNRPFRQHSSLPKANRGPWRSQRCFSPWCFLGVKNQSVFFWETVEENCVFVFFFTCQFERYERLGKFGVAFQVEDKLFKKSLRKHHLYSFWACLFLPMLFQMHPSVFCRIYAFTPKNVLSLQDKNSS